MTTALAIFQALGIKGAIAVLLAIALGFTLFRAERMESQRDEARDRLALAEAQHAVTRASLDNLAGEMRDMVAEGEARRERVAEAMNETRATTDKLRQQARDIRGDIPMGTECVTPKSVLRSGI